MRDLLAQLTLGVHLTGDPHTDAIAFLAYHGYTKTGEHCHRVAAEAGRIAGPFAAAEGRSDSATPGAFPLQAQVAGWLHDVSAVLPVARRVQAARHLGLEVLPEEETAPMLLHQKLSAVMAHQIFGIEDPSILHAIRCHTTLRAHASALDKVVFIADKIAWDQTGAPPYLDKVTQALRRSLDEAVYCYLDYLWQQRATLAAVHPWFVDAYREQSRSLQAHLTRQTAE